MILSTTHEIQGQHIEAYLGIMTAEVVYGSNFLRDWFASIRNIVGGRTGSYEQVFEKGQERALQELTARAERKQADAIVGICVQTGSIVVDEKGALLLITATGTAVKLRKN
ncbi:MAG: YbjQ family protein [Cyanobacteria bacterium J06642_2]